jgi:hypothetical protein
MPDTDSLYENLKENEAHSLPPIGRDGEFPCFFEVRVEGHPRLAVKVE